MKLNIIFRIAYILVFIVFFSCKKDREINPDFVVYPVDTKNEKIEFFWKDHRNQPFRNIENLKKYVENKNQNLKFAMNGGMFIENNIPKGLYITCCAFR
ncbi:MAG TPA: hypothetical protein DEB71_11330, partial [Chryseobacterium carnipullorum]|nr:hypothetical protein [Chryseobacterium carnipullorum]